MIHPHSRVRPEGFYEFSLWDQTAGVLDEVSEHHEALRPQFDLAVASTQAAAPQVKRVSLKAKNVFVGCLRRHVPHTKPCRNSDLAQISALFPHFCIPLSRRCAEVMVPQVAYRRPGAARFTAPRFT